MSCCKSFHIFLETRFNWKISETTPFLRQGFVKQIIVLTELCLSKSRNLRPLTYVESKFRVTLVSLRRKSSTEISFYHAPACSYTFSNQINNGLYAGKGHFISSCRRNLSKLISLSILILSDLSLPGVQHAAHCVSRLNNVLRE